jgi:hypothetical protein
LVRQLSRTTIQLLVREWGKMERWLIQMNIDSTLIDYDFYDWVMMNTKY